MRRVQTAFDIIVVGGGHAGTEAAAAAARLGASVALVSFSRAQIGAMSCNPAMGGLGKGHLIREVDAFDGLIARASDHAAIHYRMLNASKGAAVRGPRVQADRRRYQQAIHDLLAAQSGLVVVEGEASHLRLKGRRITGLMLGDGQELGARAVILATGTFLGGKLHFGMSSCAGGRVGERRRRRWRTSSMISSCRSPGSRPGRRRAWTGGPSTGRGSSASRRTRTAGPCQR